MIFDMRHFGIETLDTLAQGEHNRTGAGDSMECVVKLILNVLVFEWYSGISSKNLNIVSLIHFTFQK